MVAKKKKSTIISSEAKLIDLVPKEDSTVLDVNAWKKKHIVSDDMGFDGVEGLHDPVQTEKEFKAMAKIAGGSNQINKKITLYNFTKRNSLSRIEYIVIHFVGGVSTAKNNADYFYDKYIGASSHYFVDQISTWQVVYDSDDAWHCGTMGGYKHPRCRNANSIGIEMCCKVDAKGNWYFEEDTIKNTIDLVKQLREKYNIPMENILRHYDVTGKNCPEPFVKSPSAWIKFKEQIEEDIDDMTKLDEALARIAQLESENKKYNTLEEIPDWARKTIDKLVKKKLIVGDQTGDLGLKYDDIRFFVIMDRTGIFDK